MSDRIDQTWHWQAVEPSRNIARDYHLRIATDLFGWTTVERRWGKIGTKGQSETAAFANNADAWKAVLRIRQRRRGAIRRIGVDYREID